MMSTKFIGLQVVKVAQIREFTHPLDDVQYANLSALGLSEQDLLTS